MEILPFQTNSITKRWMEHNHTTQEVVALSLITGSFSFIAGYYQRNTCLAIGTCSFAAQQIMQRETQKGDRTPLKILAFIAFSAFVGLSLKESWSKSEIAPSSPWAAPLYIASFCATNKILIQAAQSTAKYHISQVDEKANLKLLFLIGLTAFAASTFLIPRLSHFFIPAATLYPFEGLYSKEKTLSECIPQLQELAKLSLFCCLGAIIGLGLRCGLGPKNASPTLPLVARISLYIYTGFFSATFPSASLILYIQKDFLTEAFQERLTSIDQQEISNLQKLKDHLDTQFSDLKEKMINTGFCIIIKVRMEVAKRSYEQAYQELKDLLNLNSGFFKQLVTKHYGFHRDSKMAFFSDESMQQGPKAS